MIHVIRELLVRNSGLTALVPASRISLVNARQTMERPYIVIDLEETAFENNVSGIHGEIYNILIYVTAEKISDAWGIHSQVKSVLSQFSGSVTLSGTEYALDHVVLKDVMTDAHELHDFYIVAMLFNVYVTE